MSINSFPAVPRLISTDECAASLGIAKSTLFKKIAKHEISYVKIGSRVLFDPADVAAWVDQRRVPAL